MRRLTLATAVVLAQGALVGCSTVQVSTDYDQTAHFSAYSTFDVQPASEIRDQLVHQRIVSAVEAELTEKGLRREANSDGLLVVLHGRMSTKTELDTTTYGYGWGRWGYWHRRGYGSTGVARTTVREVPVGTLVVDLVDAREKKLVWQGIASDTLDPDASPKEKDRRVREAINKMFAGFPPATR